MWLFFIKEPTLFIQRCGLILEVNPCAGAIKNYRNEELQLQVPDMFLWGRAIICRINRNVSIAHGVLQLVPEHLALLVKQHLHRLAQVRRHCRKCHECTSLTRTNILN